MIVDPDFFEHWRTRMVSDMLGGDQMAPLYIIRLWAHCQNRKSDTFDIPVAGIKAICQFAGDSQALEDALITAEYLERRGKTVIVVGWAEKNASLIASWQNGYKGGRPKKIWKQTQDEPVDNPQETHGYPTDNPQETHGKPIRVDKIREETTTNVVVDPPSLLEATKTGRGTRLRGDWVLPDEWRDWATAERPDLDPDLVADSFRDYWTAKPGKEALKLDWGATWRNWLRKQTGRGFAPKAGHTAIGNGVAL